MGNLLQWRSHSVKTIYYHGNILSHCVVLNKLYRVYRCVEGVPNTIWRNQKSVGRVELKVAPLFCIKASRRMRQNDVSSSEVHVRLYLTTPSIPFPIFTCSISPSHQPQSLVYYLLVCDMKCQYVVSTTYLFVYYMKCRETRYCVTLWDVNPAVRRSARRPAKRILWVCVVNNGNMQSLKPTFTVSHRQSTFA